MKANSWLYHYYMVQSRLQYSLAYGGQSPTALAAFYHPAQMSAAAAAGYGPAGHFATDPGASAASMLHHPHSAFLSTQPPAGSHYSTYSGYTPPPGAYQLHQSVAVGLQDPTTAVSTSSGPSLITSAVQHHNQLNHHQQTTVSTNSNQHLATNSNNNGVAAATERSSESPIDFSSATNSYSGSWQQDGNNDTDVLMRNLTSSFTSNSSSLPMNGHATNNGNKLGCGLIKIVALQNKVRISNI